MLDRYSSADTPARERVLDAAERLFMARGYSAVTLNDVAAAVGLRTASLYYHAPGGKQALFVEVVERALDRHRAGLAAAIGAEAAWTAQLRSAAAWFFSQPALDLIRMNQADMPELDRAHAERLGRAIYDALQQPIIVLLAEARDRGDIAPPDLDLLAASFLSIVQTIHNTPAIWQDRPKEVMAAEMISVLAEGISTH
jgi:AcrR family transcriptional regulator